MSDRVMPRHDVRRELPGPVPEPMIELVVRGPRAEAARGYAERKLRRLLTKLSPHVLHARIKLATAPDPAVARPALAEATLDVNGRLVRAHVAARDMHEAVDLLKDRLQSKLAHRAERRHGRSPRARPAPDRAEGERSGERRVVRRKTFALDDLTVDEAAFDMDLLDHDFYLFRELVTGGDALVHRLPDGRYGLRGLRVSPVASPEAAVDVALESELAPALTLDEAIEWLDVSGHPFVFFADRGTGWGHVAYHRYDGQYGLITPADEPAPPAEPATARRRLRDELARLEAVRATLVAERLDQESETENLSEISSIDQHPADLGTETFEREKDLSLLADLDEEIADARRAFVRLDRGTYGLCEACGRQIPDERLVARPAARFCLDHQAANEVITGLQQPHRS